MGMAASFENNQTNGGNQSCQLGLQRALILENR